MTFIRRHQLAVFYGIAVAITLVVMAVYAADPGGRGEMLSALRAFVVERRTHMGLVAIVRFAWERDPTAWLIVVFASAPTVAALLVSLSSDGAAGVRRLVSRLRPWGMGVSGRTALPTYLVLFLLYGLLALGYWIAAEHHGRPGEGDQMATILGGSLSGAALTLVAGMFLDEGGTLEELGWRGFALPRLNLRMGSPLIAAGTLGVLWWAWHLPRELPTIVGGGVTGPYLAGQGWFLLLCIVQSVVIGYLCNRTGSALPAMMVHGGTNVLAKAMAAPLDAAAEIDSRLVYLAVAAVAIVVFAGRRLGLPETDNGR